MAPYLLMLYTRAADMCLENVKFETIFSTLKAIWRTTAPILGLFVLNLMHFSS